MQNNTYMGNIFSKIDRDNDDLEIPKEVFNSICDDFVYNLKNILTQKGKWGEYSSIHFSMWMNEVDMAEHAFSFKGVKFVYMDEEKVCSLETFFKLAREASEIFLVKNTQRSDDISNLLKELSECKNAWDESKFS